MYKVTTVLKKSKLDFCIKTTTKYWNFLKNIPLYPKVATFFFQKITLGSSRNNVMQFKKFLTPPPPIVTSFSTNALVISSQNPLPPKAVTSFMDEFLWILKIKSKNQIKLFRKATILIDRQSTELRDWLNRKWKLNRKWQLEQRSMAWPEVAKYSTFYFFRYFVILFGNTVKVTQNLVLIVHVKLLNGLYSIINTFCWHFISVLKVT